MDEDEELRRMLDSLAEPDESNKSEPKREVIHTNAEILPEAQMDMRAEIINKFRNISETILDRYSEDRSQIDKACKYFSDLVASTNTPKTAWLEQWVSALRAKADTNASAVKVLDSITKLFSAGKGTNIFIQNNSVNEDADEELRKLLDE